MKPRFIASTILSLSLLGIAAPSFSELSPPQVYLKLIRSVAVVRVVTPKEAALGTAFLAFRKGVAVTCLHLVKDATKVSLEFSDGKKAEATGIVARDEAHDIAFISIPEQDRPLLDLGAVNPWIGTRVYVLGHPLGYTWAFTDGLASRWDLDKSGYQLQISTPISPGNSGSPVVDGDGKLLGMVESTDTRGQNLNFACPLVYIYELSEMLPNPKP